MAIGNCPSCGALYMPNPRGVCPKCAALEDSQYETVKAYLKSNPEARLEEVAEATGIEGQIIMRFIRSGRLVVVQPQGFGLTCERCGKAIATGVVCAECAAAMTREIRSVTKVDNSSRGVRMHRHRDGRR